MRSGKQLLYMPTIAVSAIVLGISLMISASETAYSQDVDAPERLKVKELFRVGEDQGVLFGQPAGLAVNSDGHIFVEDWFTSTVYVLSDTGELVDSLGREGEGPGEFVSLIGVFVGAGDSVYVFDDTIHRLSVFDPTTHRFAYSVSVSGDGSSNAQELIGVVDDGFLVLYKTPFYAPELERGVALSEDRFALVRRVSRRGKVIGEPVMSLPDVQMIVGRDKGRYQITPLPFGRHYTYQLGANGLLYSGWSDTINITLSTIEGQALGSIRYEQQASPVTRKDMDAYLADMSDSARRVIRDADIPETKPAYTTFVVDDQERVWVRILVEDETSRWLILNAESAVEVEVLLPASVDLKVIKSGKAYGTGEEESGAPYVIVYVIGE